MYCRNCGHEVNQASTVCTHCGVNPVTAKNYCNACAAVTKPDQELCVECGVRMRGGSTPQEGKEWMTTLLLCVFLGNFGVHRFYTGHTVIGLLHLFLCGGCGILQIYDIIMIATDKYTDSDGRPLVKK